MDSGIILAELAPEPRKTSSPQLRPRSQFGIRSLLTFITGVSGLFALMHLFGISAGNFLSAFLVFGVVALLAIGCVELAGVGRQRR